MAAPVESGLGLGEQEHATAVGVDDVKRQAPTVEETEDPAAVGSEAAPEDEQVAKKPRVEKAENGAADKEAADGDVEDEETVEELNGAKAEEEVENGAGEVEEPAEEEEDDEEAKDAAPGDGGLRTLLQEGEDAKKSAVANHGADAAHMLNGAK